MQKPLIILSSARKQSDTRDFVEKVFGGTDHDLIDLLDHRIAPFDYDGIYPENDEFMKVMDEMLSHQVIVFATPVYWYAMSGLLKNFFDRFTDIVTVKKQVGRKLKGKSIFLIAVGAEEKLPPGFELPFKNTSDYLDMNFVESIYNSIKSTSKNQEQELLIKKFVKKIKEAIRHPHQEL